MTSMCILRNKFFRLFMFNRNNSVQKINHLNCVVFLRIEEIQPVLSFTNGNGIHMSIMLQNQLFQKQKCSLVRHFLSNLDSSPPSICSVGSGTVWTLHRNNNVFYFESLLNNSICHGFSLHGKFNSNTSRMGFCPNE